MASQFVWLHMKENHPSRIHTPVDNFKMEYQLLTAPGLGFRRIMAQQKYTKVNIKMRLDDVV